MITSIEDINIEFDFTSDTPYYWSEKRNDPDKSSPTLQRYQKLLWSKKLPNGEMMKLEEGCGSNYLYWKDFRFGSDSIINMYLHHKKLCIQKHLCKRRKLIADDKFLKKYLQKVYTIGGEIIFPKNGFFSINSSRGINGLIGDRFDLTLECIRKYYKDEKSPLFETLDKNRNFFDLFISFQGFVDYFFLQDLVNLDYSTINFFLDFTNFSKSPYPNGIKEWKMLYKKQMIFLERRKQRIFTYIHRNKIV